MITETFLNRLDGVKENGRGRWMARCPAHQDRSPSLSIRELDDGRILIHDFGACSADEVLAALGLQMSDLFPDGPKTHHHPARRRRRLPARQVLDAVSHALNVVVLADADVRQGRLLTNDDWAAVDKALAVLHQAHREAA